MNPKMFRPAMKNAMRGGGRSSVPTIIGAAGVPEYCAPTMPAYMSELRTPTIIPLRWD